MDPGATGSARSACATLLLKRGMLDVQHDDAAPTGPLLPEREEPDTVAQHETLCDSKSFKAFAISGLNQSTRLVKVPICAPSGLASSLMKRPMFLKKATGSPAPSWIERIAP